MCATNKLQIVPRRKTNWSKKCTVTCLTWRLQNKLATTTLQVLSTIGEEQSRITSRTQYSPHSVKKGLTAAGITHITGGAPVQILGAVLELRQLPSTIPYQSNCDEPLGAITEGMNISKSGLNTIEESNVKEQDYTRWTGCAFNQFRQGEVLQQLIKKLPRNIYVPIPKS